MVFNIKDGRCMLLNLNRHSSKSKFRTCKRYTIGLLYQSLLCLFVCMRVNTDTHNGIVNLTV